MGNSLRAKLIPPRPGCDATSFSDWCKRMTVQAVQAAEAAEAKAMEVCLCVCVSAGAFHFRQSAARSQSCPVPLALLVYLSTLSSVSDGIATVLLPHACFLRRALRLAPTAPLHGPHCGHGRPGRRLDRHTARHDPRIASTERVVSWAQADTTYKASVHTTSYCHWVYLRKQPCVYQRPAACPYHIHHAVRLALDNRCHQHGGYSYQSLCKGCPSPPPLDCEGTTAYMAATSLPAQPEQSVLETSDL
jgi:hypothetical protein